MRVSFQLRRFFFLLSIILFSWVTAACSQILPKESVLSQLLYRDLSQYHYTQNRIDDSFSSKAFVAVFESFDPAKRIFTQEDIASLERYKLQLDDDFRQGNPIFFEHFYALYVMRVKELKPLTASLLKTPFPLNSTRSVELDPKKRDYPQNSAALKDVWKELLSHQYLTNYLLLLQEKYGSENVSAHLEKPDPALQKKALDKLRKNSQNWINLSLKDGKKISLERYFDCLVKQWDPHTTYLAPAEKENFDISMTGTLEGIGATLKDEDGLIKVVSVVVGGPAWRQKDLKANDVILKVAQGKLDWVEISGMQVNDAVKLIRGKKGSTVRLTIRRPSGQIQVISIVRDIVVLDDTYAKSALISLPKQTRQFGYIFLPVFYHNFSDKSARSAAGDVKLEIQKLKRSGVAGIILDLRNNSGGALEDAVRLSGLFIPTGPVVQVKQPNLRPQVLADTDPAVYYEGPLLVLINEWSASASEIVAAALQDYGRAVIVGSAHSYGKGTVQTLIPLDDELDFYYRYAKPLGSLKITVQKFYRINGGATQYKGVLSDIVLPDSSQEVTSGERTLPNALPWDTINPLTYPLWTQNFAQNLARVRSASAGRVGSEPVFRKITHAAQLNQAAQKTSLLPLSLKALWKKQEQLGRLQKEISVLSTPQLSVSSPDGVPALKELKDKQTEWLKTLSKDVYLKESVLILSDLIQ